MSDSDNAKPNESKKSITRREFMKLGAAATAGGLLAKTPIGSAITGAPRRAPAYLQGAKMELVLLTWFWTEPGRSDAWRAMIKKFHDSQSDIHISEAGYGENNYFTQILIQAKSGKLEGDMFCATPDVFLRLMKDGHTISLEDVVKKAGVTLSKAQDMLRKDGEVNGLDIVTVRFGLLYNKAMFDKAGVGEPKNIDDWAAGVKALTNKPNQFGIFAPHVAADPFTTWFQLPQWVVLFDGVVAKGQTPLINSDPFIKAIKLFKTMYDYMPQGTTAAESNDMFGAAKIAQAFTVSASVNEWKTKNPDVYPSLRSAKPFWPGGKAITRIHPICVNSHTDKDKQDASKVFLSWLYKKENYQELLERCLDVIPAIDGGIRKEYRDSLTWADGYDAATAITVPDTLGDFVFFNDELGNVVIPHFEDVLTGAASVEDAMGEAQKEAEALAKRVFTS